MKLSKPKNISKNEWQEIQRAIAIITEHFPNLAIFINWVSEDGETQHAHILIGNKLALQNHIRQWSDGELDEEKDENENDEIERAY